MADKPLTEEARIKMLQKEEQNRIAYAAVKDALQLIDLTQNRSITYTIFSKDSLRSYLKNPASESNQKNLRKLSNYLYTVSHVYRRLINFKAQQMTLKSWVVYPTASLIEDNDTEKTLANYNKTCRYINNMNMKSQALKLNLRMWLDDVVYAFSYGDPENDEEGFFLHVLDPDYCKICGQDYYSGVLRFAFDFSFFSGDNEFYLDVYDPIFKKMYNKYQKNSGLRWQELPVDRTVCFKINIDNLNYPVPPLSALMSQLIDLVDLQEVQNLKDELEAYKLIYAKIDTLSGTNQPDDFEIDLDLANAFYQKIQGALPNNVAFAMSPMKLDSIDFASNTANDTNIINDALENVISANGGIVLNHNKITNSTAFKLALMFDTMDAMAPVEQVNAWANLWIINHIGNVGMTVEYSDVSPFFVDDRIDKLLKVAQYSVPVKLELASLINANPAKERGMSFLEDALGLGTESWARPLVSSNTQSGINSNDDGGRPVSDDSEISADGVASRDKGDK